MVCALFRIWMTGCGLGTDFRFYAKSDMAFESSNCRMCPPYDVQYIKYVDGDALNMRTGHIRVSVYF